ncbi:Excinuclease ABC subunit C [Actinomycetales bacterium JB111]|nr:Excinuclease ABC subunit C [Actinomycetales bacterium JB111]
MADPSQYRPATSEIPTAPGVYRFLDEDDRVVYVGKAKSLRQRLTNYFQDLAVLHPRTRQMVTTAARVEWTVVSTEVEALTLEYAWIKEFDPRFNVKYRDDKSYPYLAVTLGEKFPRAQVLRGTKKKGTRYFGPYTHAWAIRDTLDQLLRVFPIRTCAPGVFRQAESSGRPCLLGYIDKCSAPCVGRISEDDHRAIADEMCEFLAGRTGPYLREVEANMRAAAAEEDFERAARLRDDAAALRHVVEQNAMVLADGTDADIFGLASDDLQAAVQVFHVRGGRIRGQRGWVVDRVEDISDAGLLTQLIGQVYGTGGEAPGGRAPSDPQSVGKSRARAADGGAMGPDDVEHTPTTAVPAEVLVPCLPDDAAQITSWLTRARGGRVRVRVPQRGDKATLLGTVAANATEALSLHKTRRAGDLTTRSQALAELTDALGLSTSPLRIECYDISHTQGTEQVGSMVVFEDGMPRKQDYRHFVVRGEDGSGARDDTAAMDEVLRRRFSRLIVEREARRELREREAAGEAGEARPPEVVLDDDGVPLDISQVDADTGRAKRFAYPPQLVVVDGGEPQVNAAHRALTDLGITDIPVVGLAKRLEEVWVPGDPFPVILPRTSPALYLLQHLRDESHRFAITHHRSRRSKGQTRSVLDSVPGLGPARQKALLKAFGSVKRIRAASVEDLCEVKGIGPTLAQAVLDALAPTS